MKSQKVEVYIDGANMFYAQKKMGWFIDWQKVKAYLERQYKVSECHYYTAVKKDDSKMIDFIKKLKSYGYKVITKPLKKIRLNSAELTLGKPVGKHVYKANFDVEISCDMVRNDKNVQIIALFSGDSDFAYALKILRKSGKRVIVYATKQTLSRELRVADYRYVLLEDIKKEIEYVKNKTPA